MFAFLARSAAVALCYFVAAKLGSELAVIGKNVSPLWPASGVALGLLVLTGPRHWPGIFIAATALPLHTGVPLTSSLLIGVGNMLEPLLAALLLRRVGFDPSLERVRDVLWLVFGGSLLAPVVSASMGTVAVCLTDLADWDRAGYVWFVWWVGNAMGVIVVAPAVLLAPTIPLSKARRLGAPRLLEAALATLALFTVGLSVFGGRYDGHGMPFSMEFLVFPVVMWISLRFGPRGAGLAAAIACGLAVWGTVREVGPFVRSGMTESVVVMQLYMAVVTLTALLLAAAVAERRSADAQVRLLAAALQSTQDGIYITDLRPDGEAPRIVYVNDALCRQTGYQREELLGRAPTLFTGPEDDGNSALREAVRTGRPWTSERIEPRKDGSSFPAEVQLAPVFGEDGAITHYLASWRDISERRELQSKLALAERLASVGTLAAGVAHEINNPLTFIRSNLEFLRRELFRTRIALERPDLQDALAECVVGAERVREIVGDLKLFSRDTGEARRPVQLDSVLELALRMASHELKSRARVVKSLGSPPLVEANEGRLGQLLVNLLVNAAQAIPPGHPDENEVRVRTGGDLESGVWVEVEDTGPGIPPEVLPRIFDPFYTTKDVGVGTGLGLTICHEIVKAYGGDISVRSEQGRGTTVRVQLPATTAQPSVAEPAPTAAPTEPGRILVIDDEPRIGQSTRRVLEPKYEVDVCLSAEDALTRLLEGGGYDVLLCDLHMPGMTGMDFHRELSERLPHLADRVLYFSGGAFTQASQDFVAGMQERVLEKPIRPEMLEKAIASVLAARGRLPRSAS